MTWDQVQKPKPWSAIFAGEGQIFNKGSFIGSFKFTTKKTPRPRIMLIGRVGWCVIDQPRTSIFHWASFGSKAQAYRAWILDQRRK